MKNSFWPIRLFCLLILTVFGATYVAAESFGTVSGQIEYTGSDVCRGMVSLWPVDGSSAPDPRLSNMVPPWVSELNDDCSFSIQADPGSYYVRVILRRSPGSILGPTRKGDLIYLSPDAQGQLFPVEIQPGQPIDIGSHGGGWAFPGYSEQIETGITGQVTDAKGRPLSGLLVHVFAERSLETPPLAVSAATDNDGQFQLRLEHGGKFFLQARENIGFGIPSVGRLIGNYGGKEPKVVKLKKGKLITDINIKAAPQPPRKIE